MYKFLIEGKALYVCQFNLEYYIKSKSKGDVMPYHGKDWYTLDNAGKLYPSITSTRVSTVFRISATLYDKVDVAVLQQALNKTIDRFPYYKVNLKYGLFWYYFEYTETYPLVEKETFYPCMFLLYKKKKIFPFRVLYFENRISVEISHSITDGNGCILFIKSLLAAYFHILLIPSEPAADVFAADSTPQEEEFEDAFHRYYVKNTPPLPNLRKAFHFPFPLNPKGEYYIITGIVPTESLLSTAKGFQTTLTQFLLGLYLDSIQEFIHSDSIKKVLPVVLNVPVNLRNLYPSKTMRNFFVSITPQIDFRLGDFTFSEILTHIRSYMHVIINPKYLNQYIHRNVKKEKSLWIRLIPLPLKNLLMPQIYSRYAERNYTSSISNLGKISMPPPLEEKIERFEFYPPPTRGNIIKVGVISFRDHTYISFGSLTKTTIIEKIFFRKMRKMQIPIKIETNRE